MKSRYDDPETDIPRWKREVVKFPCVSRDQSDTIDSGDINERPAISQQLSIDEPLACMSLVCLIIQG